ncbi:MAG: tetratricopeptide repeat protein, partial [Phycisphaeraceae bacterium]
GAHATADRYTYVPLIGLFIIIAWGGADLVTGLRSRHALLGRTLGGAAALVLAASMACSWLQTRHWRDPVALFAHALETMPGHPTLLTNLGDALESQGNLDAAIDHYRQALQVTPDYVPAHSNLGEALRSQGKLNEAIRHFRQAIKLRPDSAYTRTQLGAALRSQGKVNEAIDHFRQALRIDPDYAPAHSELGVALVSQGKLNEAVSQYHQALRIDPDYAAAHNNLGTALHSQGYLDEAILHYRAALRIAADNPNGHTNLAFALQSQGKLNEAIDHYRQALRIKPDWPAPMNGLAWILATHPITGAREPNQAIELAERAAKLTQHHSAAVLDTLAAAYAAAGRFDRAVTTAQEALELATNAQTATLADQIRTRLERYRQHKPYREPAQAQDAIRP